MTTPEIGDLFSSQATSVRRWMVRLHIPRRQMGPRLRKHCAVPKCSALPFKVYHANNKSFYGTLCQPHRIEHRRRVYDAYHGARREAKGNDLLREIRQVLPTGLPDSVRMDVEQELVLAALSGDIERPITTDIARTFISRGFKEYADQYRFVSLDSPVTDGDDVQTWGQRLGVF